MAKNMFKKYTENLVREWDVPVGTASGAIVVDEVSGRVGVTITGRGDLTRSEELPNGQTLSGIPAGGVGNRPTGATVAVDGSWLFPVAGIANGSTAVGGTGTRAGTEVFLIVATKALTLVEGDNVSVGRIDDGTIVGGTAPIQIGIA